MWLAGSTLKIWMMAFRGQCSNPAAVYYHPCSPEALYCSTPVWVLTLPLNLIFFPSWAQWCGTGIRSISHLLFPIHLILFRWFCTEKGWDCFPWSVAVGREMNTKSWLRLQSCAASDRDNLFPEQVPGMVLSSGQDWIKPSSKGFLYFKDKSHGIENFLDAQHRITHIMRN